MTRAPAAAAPKTMLMAASSLSAWRKVPPTFGIRRDMYAGSSFCGSDRIAEIETATGDDRGLPDGLVAFHENERHTLLPRCRRVPEDADCRYPDR